MKFKIPKKRTFGEKEYKLLNNGYTSLRQARDKARRLRDKGLNARVYTMETGYGMKMHMVYYHDASGKF